MATRKIEIFSAGCSVCQDVVEQVKTAACPSCDVTVVSMTDTHVAARAKSLGIRSLPAVVIDGKLASCCTNGGVDLDALRAAGLGRTG
jgi:glutaredoxin 3